MGTVLQYPSSPGSTFHESPRLPLAMRPGVSAVCVNHQRNVVTTDATMPECLSELLCISELSSRIAVTTSEPADSCVSNGFAYSVDRDLSDTQFLAGIFSAVPVFTAMREGSSLCQTTPAWSNHLAMTPAPGASCQSSPDPAPTTRPLRTRHHFMTSRWRVHRWGLRHQTPESCKPRGVKFGGNYAANTPTCPRLPSDHPDGRINISTFKGGGGDDAA
ncbi:hypothetical protein MRX96_040358 [Rhipicephalus microplus]